MNDVKTNPKQSLEDIITYTDNPVNQSELEVITCNWCKARENEGERVTIGFGFTSDWMKKWREFVTLIGWRGWCKTIYFSTPAV